MWKEWNRIGRMARIKHWHQKRLHISSRSVLVFWASLRFCSTKANQNRQERRQPLSQYPAENKLVMKMCSFSKVKKRFLNIVLVMFVVFKILKNCV